MFSILVGLGLAIYRIADFENNKAFFHNGNWTGSKNLPLGKDDLLTAQVTIFALFALPGEEAIYLFSKRDDGKEKLHSRNDYIIRGNVHDIRSRYWSITAYGKDLFLVPNKAERYSVNNSTIVTDNAGNFSVLISSAERDGNWLASPIDAGFGLLLRIYRGEKDFIEHLDEVSLPAIKVIEK